MTRRIKYQSLERFIKAYLTKNGLTIQQHVFQGEHQGVTQSQFAKELADDIYTNKSRIHDLVGERGEDSTNV